MKKLTPILIGLVLIAALAVGGFFIYDNYFVEENKAEQATEEDLDASIVVLAKDESESVYEITFTEGDNLADELFELNEYEDDFSLEYEEYDGIGIFITSVNGEIPNEDQFIELLANGEQMQVGASDYLLEENDEITMQFTLIEAF